MTKPHVTRTMGPIHFEDLDPHRFEDLVRQLAYGFRSWQSIESTGRGGADDGFDVRAYEEVRPRSTDSEEDSDPEEFVRPMEGNLWMIQCKREKAVGPKKVATIVSDAVVQENPPYGFILAAPVHFSKVAHDRFREELRARGVMEFYLWGAGELEDMLFQPKNDHILFAFFGISLVTKRRSRTASVRSTVLAKNKLMRVLGDRPRGNVLMRDLNDEDYPYEDEYTDFEKNPRWKQYAVHEFHPLGLVVTVSRHFACLDRRRKTWDYTEAVQDDQRNVQSANGEEDKSQTTRLAARWFWESLPRANRAILVRRALVRFEKVEYIDDKGDSMFNMPHLYVVPDSKTGFFSGAHEHLEINKHTHAELDGLKREKTFPDQLPEPRFGKIHHDSPLTVDDRIYSILQLGQNETTFYGVGDQHSHLKPKDVVHVVGSSPRSKQTLYALVTSIQEVTGQSLLQAYDENLMLRIEVNSQVGRELVASDKVRVVEVVAIYDWQIEQNRPIV